MMAKGGLLIGKVFGISLRLHYSWFFIFALITWALAANYFPATYPNWSLPLKIIAGLVTSILFFSSVLVHEIMHSLVAIRQGTNVEAITLFFLGGVSRITNEPKTAKDEFRMAIAGPLSSLVLGGISLSIFFALRDSSIIAYQFVAAITFYLGYINIFLGVFNLIPGFPLDGGRVLRSIIWWHGKNLRNATKIASNIGRAVGFLFIFGGIYLIFTNNWFNGVWLALIGWFLESTAVGSYRQLLLQEMLKGHVAREVMSQDCMIVSPDITIERLVNEKILISGRRCFPVSANDHAEGLISMRDVSVIPRGQWNTKLVKDAMIPLTKLKLVGPDDDLNTVFQLLVNNDINQVPVLAEGNIVGMVGRDNIINFINIRSGIERS